MSSPPKGYSRFRTRAQALVRSPERLRSLLLRVGQGLVAGGGRFEAVTSELRLMLDFLTAWSRGDYRAVSQRTVVSVAGALLYFVVPLDTIPDFILGLGYLDDVAVITYVVRVLHDELEAFRQWRLSTTDASLGDQLNEAERITSQEQAVFENSNKDV